MLGAEAQGDWANLRAQNVSLLPSPPFPPSINRSRVDGVGLFTARAGYAFGPALLYVKGGAAAVLDRYDFILTGSGIPPPTASLIGPNGADSPFQPSLQRFCWAFDVKTGDL